MEREQTFASWLKQQRKALDLTQGDVARLVGCAIVTVQKIEEGRRRPSKQVAELLARHLEIDPAARGAFLRHARAAPSAARSAATRPVPLVPLIHVPAPLTPLIGRAHEVATICAALADPAMRLVTLTGPGGIGKTRVALQIAEDLVATYADGVVFVALATIADPDLVATSIARALGVRERAGQASLAALERAVQHQHLLLALDNFEHVLAAAPVVAALLQAAPQLKVLITSRVVVGVYGEHL
jgi:transcriptional regulator with XRE-family HTH domain